MDKGEPSLVPEWLRSSGHASGGGSSNHLLISSSSHSDSASLPHNSRNKNSRSKSDVDSVHSPFLDRSSSTNSRRGSSNGSSKHPYSSFNFNRSQRDKDRSRDKDRVSYVDPWDLDTSIPLRNILTGRDQDQLRRSHSMVTRKQADHLSRGLSVGLKNGGGSSSSYNGNGILHGPSFLRTGFDKDFPSLGTEEKHGGQDLVRVSSPGLGSAVQSLPVGNSALIGGEGWTSALAEVPNVIEKACAAPLTSPKANVVCIGSSTGLNMAEALAQAPARTLTPPQGSGKTQRFEDLAIKQSRQLIPVVPSAPKSSILNSSDKSKTKQMVRAGETCLAPSRNSQQHPSVLLGNVQSNPTGQIKSEKKLLILKPARETGVAAVKESGSPSSNPNSRPNSSQLMNTAQTPQSTTVRSTNNSPREHKGITSFTMTSGQTVEKKPYFAQTQSRHAFFSALKQKTISTNISTDPVNPSTTCVSSSVEEKVNSAKELVASDSSSSQVTRGLEVTQRNTIGFEAADTPDEEEAEFLRSLGWDENNGEVEALTEEEIKAFNEQYNKLRPSLPQKLSIIQEQESVT
ncbi:Uncharacterized protein Rs2_02820 [Raphanus sativus]|uniref:Uncharacterized protein LOC108812229 n=1 Tax=Raphanus sativus TaxID=3726 RepID=A0A6J0JXV7_RAPSA|nr:uncharacterized protein LOC108812229 [Raphanus sativus]KAJ4917270.1 Uncharacterized protein Rs2_02820 [Raphanus sativus]